MNENEAEVIDSTNDTETTENVETTETVESIEEVDVEALKKENETLKAQKEHWRKKAEEPKVKVEEKKEGGLSQKDVITLAKADIHEEDVDEVIEYAKFKGISVSEALKLEVIKTTLATKSEKRTSAETANTGPARRSSAKVSDDVLINNANSGKVPESDDEIFRLLEAKRKADRQ